MKKFLLCLLPVIICAMLAIGSFAAETVIYENDFSDPSTLADFKAYRMEWEIKDGGLYLTEDFISGTAGTSLDTSFAHIIYQTEEPLKDYIIEVDYMNIQTAGGAIFRANQDRVNSEQNGFFGYISFIANNANAGALGCAADNGGWKGNINVGKTGSCNISSNVHIKAIVKGNKIYTIITNLDNGKTVYEYTHTIGTGSADQMWAEGTFGLRMRAGMKENDAYSPGTAYFDNLKVTTANDIDLGQSDVITPINPNTTCKLLIDTEHLIPVYENDFDMFSALYDFDQFRGEWDLNDGKLVLTSATGAQSYILFAADPELTKLGDYVVDVDMYNIQTSGGVIVRSDLSKVDGAGDDGIYGYLGFVANDGKRGALGAGTKEGGWLAGNIEVSQNAFEPGDNLHIQFAVRGDMLQIVMTDIDSGNVVWQWCEKHSLHTEGTFGFRLRGSANGAYSNINNVAFDNLVVSKFDEANYVEPSAPVEPEEPVNTIVPKFPVEPAKGTVIYENDFSDPKTLADFKQYRMEWEIKNGGLFLTKNFTTASGADLLTSFSHIIYQTDKDLKDYIVEVDYMNVQTAGGIVYRADQNAVTDAQNGFRGYVSFIANNANCGAVGCADNADGWKGNLNVGATGNCAVGTSVHIKVTVKGDTIHTLVTNLDTGAVVYDYTTTDQTWTKGTVGLRMRAGLKNTAGTFSSVGTAYFDNFRIVEVDSTAIGTPDDTTTPEPENQLSIDTDGIVPVYTNQFSELSDITDFEQFRGSWELYNGQLYLTAAIGSQSYILFAGDPELAQLGDYVVDVDMYNTQTQGGIILRSDLGKVTGEADDAIYGYMGFISNDGKLGAIGGSTAEGGWISGNIEVSQPIIEPGSNIHLQFAAKGDVLQLIITDIDTGKVLWKWAEKNDIHSRGTFGFRLRGKATNAGLDNLGTTSFDNLVVSKFPEKTLKMTIGQTAAYVNGLEKTLDAAPVIRGGRTMLPVRFVAENLGATVGWDGATSTASVTTKDVEIKITIGAKEAVVNGQKVALDAPAFIENGRTYLPVRFVAENLGATVAWDGATSTATLSK